MLNRISSLIRTDSLAPFLEAFAEQAVEEAKAEKWVLLLLQDFLLAERKLTYIRLGEPGEAEAGGYIYGSGISGDRMERSLSSPYPMRRIMAEALRRGSTVLVQDAPKDLPFPYARDMGDLGFRSAVCVPIRSDGVSGLLYLDHREPGRFTSQLRDRLELLAEIASLRMRELLGFRYQFLLSQAISRFNATLDRNRLIDFIVNEFKMRLGFARITFFSVRQDIGVGRLERSLPEDWKDRLSIGRISLPLDPESLLFQRLFVEKQPACLTGIREGPDGTLLATMDGQGVVIRNPEWVGFIRMFDPQPFLAVPFAAPDQVIAVLVADRLGLPIVLSEEGKKFMVALCEAFALALERADRYREMKERLDRVYEERIRREALARMASLVKDLSHVISSPVRSLINTSSAMEQALGRLASAGDGGHPISGQDELRGSLDHMQKVSRVIRNYVTYLRDLVRTEALDPVMAEARIQECIADAWQGRVARFFPSVDLQIRTEGTGIPPFLFDSVQMASVLANLFMNAARAMQPAGGAIRLTAGLDGEVVRISIQDDGPGIPEDLLRDLFSMERRMSPNWQGEGTGTGLLLCKEILFRHQANIEVRSTGGTHLRSYGAGVDFNREKKRELGTEVILELPFRRDSTDAPPQGEQRGDQL